jgi:hypothetical protein
MKKPPLGGFASYCIYWKIGVEDRDFSHEGEITQYQDLLDCFHFQLLFVDDVYIGGVNEIPANRAVCRSSPSLRRYLPQISTV